MSTTAANVVDVSNPRRRNVPTGGRPRLEMFDCLRVMAAYAIVWLHTPRSAALAGSGVIGRWIDLGYSDEDYVSWHSYVTVYFLWPPPDNIVWIIP